MSRWINRPEGSNWGDFGQDDQIGRLNLLTPERRMAALREVERGLTFALSLPLAFPGGTALSHHRRPPLLFPGTTSDGSSTYGRSLASIAPQFTDVINDDAVTLYLQYSTQWDALGHVAHRFDADGDGDPEVVYYNGYRSQDVPSPITSGACRQPLGIEHIAANGVQGRGVLVNVHAEYGRTRARVGYDALCQLMTNQQIEVRPGDILCLYFGFADALLEQHRNPDAVMLRRSFGGLDGSDTKLLNWISECGISALCADNPAVEYVSDKIRQEAPHALLPLHEHCLFKLGMPLGELWYFRELAEWLQKSGRNSFLLTAPPLNLPGACGSPVTPVALV